MSIVTRLLLLSLSFLFACSGPELPAAVSPTTEEVDRERPVANTKKSEPPLARRDAVVDEIHGTKVADPYRWLEDGESKETKAWLQTLDGHTRAAFARLPGRKALLTRLMDLSYIEWISPPVRRGSRYFFSRRHKDKEKSIIYWREGKAGEPKVLLDPNGMSDDGSVSLKGWWPSYDGKWVVYELSENNADESKLYLMDVATNKVSDKDVIPGVKYAEPAWTPSGTGFYYNRLPIDPNIPVDQRPGYAEIYFHKLGTDYQSDQLIHEKTGDPKTFLGVDLSRDGHYLFIYKHYGWLKNEVWFKDLRKHKKFQPFAVGHEAKFYAEAWKEQIYVRTNLDAPKWRMMRVDPAKPTLDNWTEIVAEKPKAVLRGASVIGDHLVLRYLKNASSQAKVMSLGGKHVRDISLPGIGSVSGISGNPEDDEAYYGYSSFTVPTTVYETSIKNGGKKTFFELDVPIDAAPYTTEQVWYQSKDGTKVSMFIIRRKDLKKNGDAPVLLYGYGGFNISLTPSFRAPRFVWFDRGGVLAIPNLRGGGEYGEAWHRDGMREKKQNVFDDFIGAAQYLIDNGYTKPEKLAIQGGSNGGLLVGAAMTQRPELFGAVVCAVPLLDMVRYHLFGSGRTWISEYGSSEDPDLFKAILAYSPYHRLVKGQAYPAMLMLTADSDDRVDPLHARKFVARMRYNMGNDADVFLRMESKAGHGGGDMVKKRVARTADVYTFLFDQLGMN